MRVLILSLAFLLVSCDEYPVIEKPIAIDYKGIRKMTNNQLITARRRLPRRNGWDKETKEKYRKAVLDEVFRRNSHWSSEVKSDIRKRYVHIGMTKDQVLISWGRPNDINRTVGTWGTHEQWVYGETLNRRYLYFQDGIMTSFQD